MEDIRRRFINRIFVVMGALLCLICLTACDSKRGSDFSIVGEWIVDSYAFDGGIIIPPDELGDYIGIYGANLYNNRKFIFFDDGTFVYKWMNDVYGDYTIADSILKLSDDDGNYLLLSIHDDFILLDESESKGFVSRYKKN